MVSICLYSIACLRLCRESKSPDPGERRGSEPVFPSPGEMEDKRRGYRGYRVSPENRSHASSLGLESEEHIKSLRLLGKRSERSLSPWTISRHLLSPPSPPYQHAKTLPVVHFNRLTFTHYLPSRNISYNSRSSTASGTRFPLRIAQNKKKIYRLKQVNTVMVSSTLVLKVHTSCDPSPIMPCCKEIRRLCLSLQAIRHTFVLLFLVVMHQKKCYKRRHSIPPESFRSSDHDFPIVPPLLPERP
jgi:hypothetical protein